MTTDRRTSVYGSNLTAAGSKHPPVGSTQLKHSEHLVCTLLIVSTLCIFGQRVNPSLLFDTDAQLILGHGRPADFELQL